MRRWSAVLVVLALVGFGLSTQAADSGDRAVTREQFRERMKKVREMRWAALEFFAAKESGNREVAMAAADKAKSLWQGLPEKWQKAIEERHPGTSERIVGLREEYDVPEPTALARPAEAPEGGKAVTTQGTKDGNTLTHQGSVTVNPPATGTWKPTYADDTDIFGGRPKPAGTVKPVQPTGTSKRK